MNRVKRVCRVCGKAYEACATPGRGSFRWQDVACCREHYLVYHEQIVESRKQQDAESQEDKK
jgi:hypothetical protein